jgi:steroid 5-alpha reductase family enzyme
MNILPSVGQEGGPGIFGIITKPFEMVGKGVGKIISAPFAKLLNLMGLYEAFMAIATVLSQSFGILYAGTFVLYIVAQLIGDNTLIDLGWGLGFAAIAIFTYYQGTMTTRAAFITGLLVIWGTRLALHLLWRYICFGPDKRHQTIRASWGGLAWLQTFLSFYLLQNFLVLLIVVPVLIINMSDATELTTIDYFGMALAMIGFLIEVISDLQLHMFRKKYKDFGQVCNIGLWGLSRHPNYLGDFVMWTGIWLTSYSLLGGPAAVISPTVLLILFYTFSIPTTEQEFAANSVYQEYKKSTSCFFPWF